MDEQQQQENITLYHHRHDSGKCLVKNDEEKCPSCNGEGLTVGVLYNNEESLLEDTLKDWSRWSAPTTDATDFVVVDDGSDEAHSATAVIERVARIVPLPVIRTLTITDHISWDISGARNLLMHKALHCRTLMMDVDYLVPEALAVELMKAPIPSDVIYRFERNYRAPQMLSGTTKEDAGKKWGEDEQGLGRQEEDKDEGHYSELTSSECVCEKTFHPGIMCTSPQTYFRIGGADEDFAGHYGLTDPLLVWRAGRAHVPLKIFPSSAKLLAQPNAPRVKSNRTRDASHNQKLFASKTKGTVPFSTTYLRFRWTETVSDRRNVSGLKTRARTSFMNSDKRWLAHDIVSHMREHPDRAYFADLFRYGGFKSGVEVGLAEGRFSEHMLLHGKPERWIMVEPDMKVSEKRRETWKTRHIGQEANLTYLPKMSLEKEVLDAIPLNSLDFVYLDGAHDYENVKKEMEPYFERLRPGGVLAGHDYQAHGEFKGLSCKGCDTIPNATQYTEYGIANGKKGGLAASQAGVVRAVQEWLVELHPEMTIRYTSENFTRDSLSKDGFDYDLVITSTRNPSWYLIKGESSP